MDTNPLTVIRASDRGANPRFLKAAVTTAPDELIEAWEESLDDSTNYHARDTIVEAMERRGIRPSSVIDRDMESGLYPDIEDPEFAGRLFRKTEFSALASIPAATVDEEGKPIDVCKAGQEYFDTTAVQRLVSRFLHPSTPYRSLLLNHGVGVGKTCSAVTVAETFLDAHPTFTVYIIAPQAIEEGFRRTIFDVSKLVPASKDEFALTGERWRSPQCTGMTYLRMAGVAASESREEIQTEVNKLIRRRYKIMGYRAFANWVKRNLDTVPDVIKGPERIDKQKEVLRRLFCDHLIIVDEAHNLRDPALDDDKSVDVDADADADADEPSPQKATDAAEGKLLTPILQDILLVAEGLRLMLMTATPMYNVAPEIVFLLQLLKLNDTKDESKLAELSVGAIFSKDNRLTDAGKTILAREIRRYVSYMRGENPATFPLRLTPPDANGAELVATYPEISIAKKYRGKWLTTEEKDIFSMLPLVVHKVGPETPVGAKLSQLLEENAVAPEERDSGKARESSSFLPDITIQIANLTYPDESYGNNGWNSHFAVSDPAAKVKQYRWKSTKTSIESVFAGKGLEQHAPKIATIVKSVSSAKGISFIYSRYVKSGALPLAIALEMAGWCRVLADGTPAPILNLGGARRKYKHFYILLTSEVENFKDLVKYATLPENAHGDKVKAIIGSHVASEGLDLKCIRELHLLDGWYHLNRIEQIEGRGVRFCSHVALPMAERNCLIYLHAVSLPEYETGDLYAYRTAVRKAIPVGEVTRLMKQNAWDCMLNIDAIMLKDVGERDIVDAQGRPTKAYDLQDKPYTSFCDFMKCGYTCTITGKDLDKPNTSTYTAADMRRRLLEIQERITDVFATETVYMPIDAVRKTFYRGVPADMASIGLREMLGKVKLRREDGLYGTIVLKNGVLVFQPDKVTDYDIPMALRFGRAYGRLAREFNPLRKSVLQTSAPGPVAMETEADIVEEAGPVDDIIRKALDSVDVWKALVEKMMTKESGELEPPLDMPIATFNGLRWLYHQFAGLGDEAVAIACRWWMDNIWTREERVAVLSAWTKTPPKSGVEKMYADSYRPIELFTGELSGFLSYDAKDKMLSKYCFIAGDDAPSLCTEIFKKEVDAAIGKPVDREKDTGPVFGMNVTKKGDVLFKSVEKGAGSKEGAECSNTSNLGEHVRRITLLQNEIRKFVAKDAPILALIVDDSAGVDISEKDRNKVQDALAKRYNPKSKKKITAADADLVVAHLKHMSQKQLCPYMEFLMRWMDRQRLGGKRWFLTTAEAARAGAKMA